MLGCILNCAYFFNRRFYCPFPSDFMMSLRSVSLSFQFEMSRQLEIWPEICGQAHIDYETRTF